MSSVQIVPKRGEWRDRWRDSEISGSNQLRDGVCRDTGGVEGLVGEVGVRLHHGRCTRSQIRSCWSTEGAHGRSIAQCGVV